LSDKNIGQDIIDQIQARFNQEGAKLSERANVTGDVVKEILLSCR